MKKLLRLGTRGSPLALIQAEMVRSALQAADPSWLTEGEIELVPISTTGDWRPSMGETPLEALGANKGLFTKEIDEALMSGHIDAAVHSVKDCATELPKTLCFAAFLKREDPRDAFISIKYDSLLSLPQGAIIGTASLRRAAQVLAIRPDLRTATLRGNVDTRLKKIEDGAADATFLAVAGLQRLGLGKKITETLDTDTILPAVGQGAIGIVVSKSKVDIQDLFHTINHAPTEACVLTERAFLAELDGSCKTPIAALARLASDNLIILEGLAARPNGTDMIRLQESGAIADAEKIGHALGQKIRAALPPGFFEDLACLK